MVYSKEELIRKLHLSKHSKIVLFNTDGHSSELSQIVTQNHLANINHQYDVIFVHVYTLSEMKELLNQLWKHDTINEGGIVYLIYPKLNNPYYHGIHRDHIFPALEVDDAMGLVPNTHFKFNKMVSLNETFTIIGLKNLSEKDLEKLIKPTSSNKPSGRVEDYVKYIPEIQQRLNNIMPELGNLFDQLTPGKQRNWAREIYSARTENTQNKRYQKLINELQN